MKHLSLNELADIVVTKRQKKHLTQAQLSEQTGIHRTMIGALSEATICQPSHSLKTS